VIPVFSIYLGDAKTMFLKTVLSACTGSDPLDLTSCAEIDVALPKADGTLKHYLLSEGAVVITAPAVLGKFSVAIDAAVSVLLNVGEFQDFTVTFTIAGVKFSVGYSRALSVFQ
jgi:hypothetical protein